MEKITKQKNMQIGELNRKLTEARAILASNSVALISLQKAVDAIRVTDMASYKAKQVEVAKLVNHICEDNKLQALTTKYRYDIKRRQLSTNPTDQTKLTPEEFYEFVKYAEDTNEATAVPFRPLIVTRINKAVKKSAALQLKLDFVIGIASHQDDTKAKY
ncbi:hypothetical protein Barb4_05057 [Bacteroidales bacterium Barb4]|nr:hypothetical protein Barb4_05057 [Bacteroidales bacterium Barb4]